MSKISLVIMAAGIGSRFGGGIKQLTGFGPCGEIIMDYSVHDALEAGFDQIIFVIRKDLEKDFKEIIGNRISRFTPVRYAFQELTDLPEGFTLPEGRKKPWGTGQAILACRGLTDGPFAVINADDYYGKDAFRKVDMSADSQRVCGMFRGDEYKVKLRFANHLAGAVIDRFGKDAMLIRDGEEHFTVTIEAAVSPQFFAWVFGFGPEAEILSPESVRREAAAAARRILGLYE